MTGNPLKSAETPSAGPLRILVWVLRMAWRDSRRSRKRLLLYVSSMVLGVAALVAITSFGHDMLRAVDSQARELIGADIRFERDAPFEPESEAIFDSLGGDQARLTSFASMAFFPHQSTSRLSRIRALEGGFPFYGAVESEPADALEEVRSGNGALVDEALLLQSGASVGDSLYVGRTGYVIAGKLIQVPGESATGALFGPRVFIPQARLDTMLLGRGSRVEYEVYIRLPEDGADPEQLREDLRPHLDAHDIGVDTIHETRSEWGEALEDLYAFMNLVAFVALLLGGLGVASSVHVYARQKIDTVAVLRCIGASSGQTFAIYVVQAAAMGIVGSLFGVALGIGIQQAMPFVLGDFLPVDVQLSVSIPAILEGLSVGISVSIVFALLPLVQTRLVPPLRVLRAAVEAPPPNRDKVRWVLIALVVGGVLAFAYRQTESVIDTLAFSAAVAAVFGLLYGTARLVMMLVRRFFPRSWPYVWRQGLANLYRPSNQTAVLLVALGLGTFLIMTLYMTQEALLGKIQDLDREGEANVILFDIQPEQVAGVERIVDSLSVRREQTVPIVTMRLTSVSGRRVEELLEDTTYEGSRWPLRREYRSTYRDRTTDTEELVEGSFTASVPPGDEPVPISIEEDIAEDLHVTIGDELLFDVQGLPVRTVIESIRRVDWQRVSTNFFVVFPTGVLERAPQFHVLTARVETNEQRASLQNGIVRQYPNVSIIDLEQIFDAVQKVLDRLSFVVRFMALFSVLTGLLVLFSSVLVGRYQRIRDGVLLRTIGASGRQLMFILATEYILLGFLAAGTGSLLATAAGWAVAFWAFDISFVPPLMPVLISFALVTGITLIVGLANSREIVTRPPLEILRTTAL